MSVRSISPEQEPVLAREYEAGVSTYALAVKYGCSTRGITSALDRQGVQRRDASASKTVHWDCTPHVEERVLDMYRGGASVRQLAKHFGVRTGVISDLLARRAEPLHAGGRTHPRFRSTAQCQEVADLYLAGADLRTLAERFSTTTPTITKALHRVGVEPRAGRPLFWTEERLVRLVDLFEAGLSHKRIGVEMGVSQTAVSERLRLIGLTEPDPRPTREASPTWKGGRFVSEDGYVLVMVAEEELLYCTPYANGYVREHRLVMGRALGRKLRRNETVHHIDGNRENNALSNLQLRQGHHGTGVALECLDCGSHNVQPVPLRERAFQN